MLSYFKNPTMRGSPLFPSYGPVDQCVAVERVASLYSCLIRKSINNRTSPVLFFTIWIGTRKFWITIFNYIDTFSSIVRHTNMLWSIILVDQPSYVHFYQISTPDWFHVLYHLMIIMSNNFNNILNNDAHLPRIFYL